ncbi:MAG: sulfotransferase [Pseudomonadota bacterium]
MIDTPQRGWLTHARQRAQRVWRVVRSPALAYKSFRVSQSMGVSEAPHIFVLGIPRAGTTLLASILAAHTGVSAFRLETHFFLQRNYQYLRIPGVDPADIRSMVLTSTSRVDLYDRLARRMVGDAPAPQRVLEKTPGHARLLPELLTGFPNAQFVFLIREPRDAYASLQGGVKLPRFTPAQYADFWNRLTDRAASAPTDRVHMVRYEDMVCDPVACLQAVCSFLGLDYQPDMLSPDVHAQHSPEYSSRGDHKRLGKAITPSSIGKWKQVLPEDVAALLHAGCRTNAVQFGYD